MGSYHTRFHFIDKEKKKQLGFIVQATTMVISRPRFRGDSNLEPPDCRQEYNFL